MTYELVLVLVVLCLTAAAFVFIRLNKGHTPAVIKRDDTENAATRLAAQRWQANQILLASQARQARQMRLRDADRRPWVGPPSTPIYASSPDTAPTDRLTAI